jgi:hypothetical protein
MSLISVNIDITGNDLDIKKEVWLEVKPVFAIPEKPIKQVLE